MKMKAGWIIGTMISVTLVVYCGWLVLTEAPAYQFLVRLYSDKHFLKETLHAWGILAPLIFIALQALQVIMALIPGDITGLLGGFLFGEWLGLFYSTIGLTLGSVAAFGVGRWLGAHYVRTLVSQQTWDKMGFIIEAEGTILCFIIFLIPGLPKRHALLSLRNESHAPLGLHAGLNPRPLPRHLGIVGAGGSHSSRGLSRGNSSHGYRVRGSAAPLLLPRPNRGVGARLELHVAA